MNNADSGKDTGQKNLMRMVEDSISQNRKACIILLDVEKTFHKIWKNCVENMEDKGFNKNNKGRSMVSNI